MKKILLIIAAIIIPVSVVWSAPPTPPSSGGTPGGTSGQIQYNNSGAFGGYDIDTDLSSVSATDNTVPSAKATKTALDGKQANMGITAISDSTSTTSSTTAASATGLKAAYDLANGKGAAITKGYASFSAGSFIPDTCSGLLQNDSDPNQFDYLAFDGATDEYAQFMWIPPDDWDASTIKVKFIWAAGGNMDAAQTIIWGINGYAVGDGDTLDVAFNSGEVTVSDAYADSDETGPIQKITAASGAITIQGTPTAGKPVYFRVSRDADTDTSILDAWLIGLTIEYGKTGTTPAAW